MTTSFESAMNSHEFFYSLMELQSVQADLEASLCADFALVRWASRRDVCNDPDSIKSMRYIISGLERCGSMPKYLNQLKDHEVTRAVAIRAIS